MNHWWNSPPSTATWVLMLVVFFVAVILLAPASAAVRPVNPDTSITPQTAKEAQKPTCLDATTRTRLLVYPNGRKVITGQFTTWEACK